MNPIIPPNVFGPLPGPDSTVLLDENFNYQATTILDTVAALRLTTPKTATVQAPRVFLTGYGTVGDGGGGLYWFNPADTTSPDNGGSIIVASDGGRWYLTSNPQSALQFGADPTGVADSTSAFTNIGSAFGAVPIVVIVPAGTYKLNSNPTPSGTVTWVLYSNATFTGAGVLPGYFVNLGNNGYSPTGNSVTTNSALTANCTTQIETRREFAAAIGMVATHGATQTNSGSGDKTALYTGIVGQTGGGNIWSINPLTTIASGWTGETGGTVQSAQVAEFDLNNNNTDYGNAGSTVYGNPSATGLVVTGAGSHFCQAAMQIVGNVTGGTPMWRYGIWLGNNSIGNYAIADTSNSTTSYQFNGSHTYGIDFNAGSFSAGPIRLGNNQPILSRNNAGTADRSMMILTGAGDNMKIGDASVGGIFMSANTVPLTDNTYSCGQSGGRWTAVWAVNGTIQTSDPSLKTDIEDLPQMLSLVQNIHPKRYRWKVGGYVTRQEEVETDIPVTETHSHEVVDLVNGVPTLKIISEEFPARDFVQVVDSNGAPVFELVRHNRSVLDEHGQQKFDDKGYPQTVSEVVQQPKMHPVARTKKGKVTRQISEPREGARTHCGFMAPDIKAAFDSLGIDFAGYVKADDGTHHLRPDQLIPVLWKAVQELAAEFEAYKKSHP